MQVKLSVGFVKRDSAVHQPEAAIGIDPVESMIKIGACNIRRKGVNVKTVYMAGRMRITRGKMRYLNPDLTVSSADAMKLI